MEAIDFSAKLISKILKKEIVDKIYYMVKLSSWIDEKGNLCEHLSCISQCADHIAKRWIELQRTEKFPDYTIKECLEYINLNEEAIGILLPHITEIKKVYPTVHRYFYDIWNIECGFSDENAAGVDYFRLDDKYEIWSIRKYNYESHLMQI